MATYEELEARCRIAYDAIINGLRAAGATVELNNLNHITEVDGMDVLLAIFEEQSTNPYRRPAANGRIRATVRVGWNGKNHQFPEGKNGIYIDRVVGKIMTLVKQEYESRLLQAEADSIKQLASMRRQDILNTVAGYTNVGVVGGPKSFTVKFHNLTSDMAMELLDFARTVGILPKVEET